MRTLLHILGLLLAVAPAYAQSPLNTDSLNTMVKQANQLYGNGHYSDAAKIYETVLQQGLSAELYYNLGNCYYKLDEIGLSILNYERALRLKPGSDDAAYNLALAESRVVGSVEPSPAFFVKRWTDKLINSASSNRWVWISFTCFILSLGALLYFLFATLKSRRKASFYTFLVAIVLAFVTGWFAGARKEQFLKHRAAVVLSGAIAVKSAPDASGTDLFQLHEGAKVHVKSTLGAWAEIRLDNGAIGWVQEKDIARI